jgi:hypothetical protein
MCLVSFTRALACCSLPRNCANSPRFRQRQHNSPPGCRSPTFSIVSLSLRALLQPGKNSVDVLSPTHRFGLPPGRPVVLRPTPCTVLPLSQRRWSCMSPSNPPCCSCSWFAEDAAAAAAPWSLCATSREESNDLRAFSSFSCASCRINSKCRWN